MDYILSFYCLYTVMCPYVPFMFGVLGRMWNLIISVSDHCFSIYIESFTELWWIERSCLFLTCCFAERGRISYEEYVCHNDNFCDIFHCIYSGILFFARRQTSS